MESVSPPLESGLACDLPWLRECGGRIVETGPKGTLQLRLSASGASALRLPREESQSAAR